jgi:hypothetical protein
MKAFSLTLFYFAIFINAAPAIGQSNPNIAQGNSVVRSRGNLRPPPSSQIESGKALSPSTQGNLVGSPVNPMLPPSHLGAVVGTAGDENYRSGFGHEVNQVPAPNRPLGGMLKLSHFGSHPPSGRGRLGDSPHSQPGITFTPNRLYGTNPALPPAHLSTVMGTPGDSKRSDLHPPRQTQPRRAVINPNLPPAPIGSVIGTPGDSKRSDIHPGVNRQWQVQPSANTEQAAKSVAPHTVPSTYDDLPGQSKGQIRF